MVFPRLNENKKNLIFFYLIKKFLKEKLCNKTSRNHICPEKGFCSCVHYLEFELNDLVELVLIDGGSLPETHSTHLHGYKFAVLGMDKVLRKIISKIKFKIFFAFRFKSLQIRL